MTQPYPVGWFCGKAQLVNFKGSFEEGGRSSSAAFPSEFHRDEPVHSPLLDLGGGEKAGMAFALPLCPYLQNERLPGIPREVTLLPVPRLRPAVAQCYAGEASHWALDF